MATFFLRSNKINGRASLYVKVAKPSISIQWMLKTGIDVDVAAWIKSERSAKEKDKYYSTKEGEEVHRLMKVVDGTIKNYLDGVSARNADKKLLEEKIKNVVRLDSIKADEELAEIEANRLRIILNYYKDFMIRIESGELRQGRKNQAYRSNSLSIWRTFGKHLEGYLEKKKCPEITFDKINKAFADGFTNYLEGRGLMLATINQQVNCFRRLCNAAAEEEYNKNGSSLRIWHSHEEKDEDKRAEIVLSESEIDALYSLKLEGLREQVRDMWCLGYFCAQRVSDYSRLSRDNFKQLRSGLKVIALQQQKTGKDLIIPILDDRVFEICEKYDYNFPELTRDNQNRFIKLVAKELSEDVPSLKEWNRTLLTLRERQKEESFISMRKRVEEGEVLHGEESKRFKRMCEYAAEHESGELLYKRDFAGNVIRQRWELITCHTSRRSMVTAMYDSGIYDLKDIMAISGHQTLKNVERYLKRDAITQAERIAEKTKKAKEIKMRKGA